MLGHFSHRAGALSPVKNRQALRSHEVRRIHDAKLAVDLREDHVEVNRRSSPGMTTMMIVFHFGMLEQHVREMVDRRPDSTVR